MRNKLMMLTAVAALGFASGASAQTVTIKNEIPLAADNEISSAVKSECQLGWKLSDSIGRHSAATIDRVDGDLNIQTGRVLQVEITDAGNMGNAFTGRQTFTKIRGTLYQDGQKVAGFKARRNSMGGAFAGFKGACAVLGRTVEVLGKDVAAWLSNPQDGAALGD